MKTKITRSGGPRLGSFPNDVTIIDVRKEYGNDPGPGKRFRFEDPNGRIVESTKPIYNRTEARAFNDWLHNRIPAKSTPKVEVTQVRPRGPEDIVTQISGQWYCMSHTGQLYAALINTRDGVISYANKVIDGARGKTWAYPTIADRIKSTGIFARY